MKAITRLHLIIYITIITALASCENEIPYNPGHLEPLLIMNTQLNADSDSNLVYLHLSEGNDIGRINEATLSLYVNGQLAESPNALTPEEMYGHLKDNYGNDFYEILIKNVHFKKFPLSTALHPGDIVRLEATAENGKYHVSSEVTVPQPIENLQVDTCTANVRVYNGWAPHRQYKITVHDRPNEKNFYRLEILNTLKYRCQYREYAKDENGDLIPSENGWDWVYTLKDTLITSQSNELINREDVILTDGHPSSYDDEENEMFPNIKNKYNVFSDSRFSNSSTTLKVYTELFEDKHFSGLDYVQIYRTHTITVRLLSLTEAQYRYMKALNCLEDENYDEVLMEPVSFPTNVEGGLGFVGVSIGAKATFQFPETPLWNR